MVNTSLLHVHDRFFFFWVGVCRLILRILTLFQRKNCSFPQPFSELASKIHTHFQTWRLSQNATYVLTSTEIMSSLPRLERQQKDFFLFYSFIIETTKTFIQYCSSLVNHTRFQTKMGTIYTRFQTNAAPKPYSLGRHIPVKLIFNNYSSSPNGL